MLSERKGGCVMLPNTRAPTPVWIATALSRPATRPGAPGPRPRAAATTHGQPAEGLAELNSVLLRELDPQRFCTVLFGTLEPLAGKESFRVTIATGGHPPALLVDPTSGKADEVRSSDGMLVGMIRQAVFDSCVIELHPGQTLLFYTDGIIEARRGADPFDQDSLAAFAVERARLDAAG